ncbi:MAG: hypothetical protein H6977_07535 [Gammaproteobacteria bacterium]|nr:hypothetical protein [Gammaproteobacteria bacterium]MCP5199848.1 hypothetical protein [Gammaproteobacteria bacterium]
MPLAVAADGEPIGAARLADGALEAWSFEGAAVDLDDDAVAESAGADFERGAEIGVLGEQVFEFHRPDLPGRRWEGRDG